jgi:hypothetical protein
VEEHVDLRMLFIDMDIRGGDVPPKGARLF